MSDWFERYHGALAIEAGVAGLVLAVLFALRRHPGRRGRFGPIAVVVAGLLWWHEWLTFAQALGLGVASLAVVFTARCRDSAMVPVLALISLVGVWAAVPDTEPAVLALGVVAVPIVLARVRRARAGDRVVAIVLVVVTAWAGSAGLSEIVGGIACVGALVAPLPRRPSAGVVVTHLALVFVASRVLTGWSWHGAEAGLAGVVVVAWIAAAMRGASRLWSGGPRRDAEHA